MEKAVMGNHRGLSAFNYVASKFYKMRRTVQNITGC